MKSSKGSRTDKSSRKWEPAVGQGTNYSPPPLWTMKPEGHQFEPTPDSAIRSTKRMAGVK